MRYFILVLCLVCASCRTSKPPVIEVCILDGFGGADCIETDGSKKVKLPSEIKNYWATNQNDMANFAGWCYQTTPQTAGLGMASLSQSIHQ